MVYNPLELSNLEIEVGHLKIDRLLSTFKGVLCAKFEVLGSDSCELNIPK